MFSKREFSSYWNLTEGYLACRTFNYIGHYLRDIIVWDASLFWTEGYLVYVTFGHCLRDTCSIAGFIILGNV